VRGLAAITVALVSCTLEESGLLPGDAGVDVVDAGFEASVDAGADVALDAADAAETTVIANPTALSGLSLWLRGDLGVVLSDAGVDGAVAAWTDQSGANDPLHDALQANISASPSINAVDVKYNQRQTLSFPDGTFLRSGAWPIVQPATYFIVGHAGSNTVSKDEEFIDSTSASQHMAIVASYNYGYGLSATAGLTPPATFGPTQSPTFFVVVFFGANSLVYAQSNTGVAFSSGTQGSVGYTLGNYVAQENLYALRGALAEVAIWARALSPVEIAQLNAYASQRYAIALK